MKNFESQIEENKKLTTDQGTCFRDCGDLGNATKYYEMVRNKFSKLITSMNLKLEDSSTLDTLKTYNPVYNYFRILFLLSDVYMEKEEYKKSEELKKECEIIFENYLVFPGNKYENSISENCFLLALLLNKLNKAEEAEKYYSKTKELSIKHGLKDYEKNLFYCFRKKKLMSYETIGNEKLNSSCSSPNCYSIGGNLACS